MAISLKHAFQSAQSDGGDATLVRPSNWNAEHVLQLATARLVGRTTAGTGDAEEISVGSNLSLAAGVLDLASNIAIVSNSSTAALRVTQTGTGNALLVEDSANPDSTPFVVDASGNVGIGTTTPANELTIYNNDAGATAAPLTLELYRDSASPAQFDHLGRILFSGENSAGSKIEYGSIYGTIDESTIGRGSIKISPSANGGEQLNIGLDIYRWGGWWAAEAGCYLGLSPQTGVSGQSGLEIYTTNANTNAPYLQLTKARGVVGTETGALAGDALGAINYSGYNGTTYSNGARIRAVTSEAWGSGATGTELRFSTTATGATGDSERIRIGPSGEIGIGGANYGIAGQVITSGGTNAAPTWEVSGGLTLLGTITTTSGTSQALSSLTLTPYKELVLVWQGVSHNSGSTQSFLVGTSTANDVTVTPTGWSAADTLRGVTVINLSTGTFATNVGNAGTSAGVNSSVAAGDTVLSTASTAVSVAPSAGSFDAGSILVYGLK